MVNQVIQVSIRTVLPSANGFAVFVGTDEKVFVIYVDQGVGTAIAMLFKGLPRERPLTHDLFLNVLTALGARIERAIINDIKTSTYFARLIISAENELHTKKILEIDARPSDSIALALAQSAPIYVTKTVWDEVEDMSDLLRQIESGPGASEPDGPELH